MESLGSKTSPTDMVLSAKVAEELAQTWQPAGVQPAGPSLPPWLSPSCPASSRLTPPQPGLWGHVFARGRLCRAGRCDRSGQPGSCLLPQDRLTSPNQAVTASRGQEIQRQCPVHATGLSKVPALQLKAPQAPDRRVCRWSPIPGAA